VRLKKILRLLTAAVGAALVAVAMTASPAMADREGTTTTLTLPSHRVVLGLESNFAMSVEISAPEGTWAIEAGSPSTGIVILCGDQPISHTSCFMPPNALPPGNYNLIAIYNGDENFDFSASGLEPLTVIAQQPTSTSLSLSASTVVFGHEDSEVLQVFANGDTGNPAEGFATVLLGSEPLSPATSTASTPRHASTPSCWTSRPATSCPTVPGRTPPSTSSSRTGIWSPARRSSCGRCPVAGPG
jgi:hypothetical protein